MKTVITFSAALFVMLSVFTFNAQAEEQPAEQADTGFSRFAALVGTWTGIETHEGETKQITVTYELTAGGTAVLETLFVGSEHEMVSLLFNDGEQLTMTHYCMLGNQPTMVAQPVSQSDRIEFVCVGGTNMPDENVMHMHEADYTFLGGDRLESTWTLHEGGQAVDSTTFILERAAE